MRPDHANAEPNSRQQYKPKFWVYYLNVAVRAHLYAVTFWLLAAAEAAEAPGRSSQPAECTVAGFVLKTKQLPRSLSSPGSSVLFTMRSEDTTQLQATPDAAATAAACNRTEACAMFTSDGFLIGVYRIATTVNAFNAAIALEQQGGGPLSWVPMQYCAGWCCGTWMAEGLEQQLLIPAADNATFEGASSVDLPTDGTQRVAHSFDAVVMKRFCALAQASRQSATPAGAGPAPHPAQQQQQCPQHCQVACCADFANVSMTFDRHNNFEQCAANPCAGCSLPGNSSAVISGAVGRRPRFSSKAALSAAVLKRQYLRAASVVESNSSIVMGASDAAADIAAVAELGW